MHAPTRSASFAPAGTIDAGAKLGEILRSRSFIEQNPAIPRQQIGKLRPQQLGHGRPHPRPRIQRIDPDQVDAQVGGPPHEGIDGRLGVGKERQEGAEHHGRLQARPAHGFDHLAAVFDAGGPRLP